MKTFTMPGAEARAFFARHGYAVFAPRFAPCECAGLRDALELLLGGYARDQGLAMTEYLQAISQWRDLWRQDETFAQALGDERLYGLAAALMQRPGARLLHDHVIDKPGAASGTVPWHQDYPYWPVDTADGLSCWMPLEDVGSEGGCLEVIAGSHLRGERPPVDFINEQHPELDGHPDAIRLPVTAGSIVVLHCLTWHRTGPNLAGGRRRAYITLWLPPEARYAPAHADWHPTNEHVSVAPGEVLNDDWFPCFGERGPGEERVEGGAEHGGANHLYPVASTETSSREPPLSMFSASQTIAAQVRTLLGQAGRPVEPGGLGVLLADDAAREALVAQCLRIGVTAIEDGAALRAAVLRLYQCSEAYRLHRARNVYNDAYVQWWRLAGARFAALA